MRTLHVVPSLAARTGGPAFNVAALTSGLVDAGVHAAIYTTDMATPASSKGMRFLTKSDIPPLDDRVELHVFKSRVPRRFAYAPTMATALMQRIRDFDIVHLHSLFLYPQAVAARIARDRGVPYIVSPRGSLDPWVRAQGRLQKQIAGWLWQNRLLSHAAAMHVAGPGEAEYIADISPNVPRLVAPNGIHVDGVGATLEERDGLRSRLSLTRNDVVVLYLGRLSKKKNLPALIDAFATSANGNVSATLVIAGPDDENLARELRAQADARELGSRIRFLPEVRAGVKRMLYAVADVFVLPSHTENFGVAAIEALATGCPVIVSDGVAIAPELAQTGAVRVVSPTSTSIAGALGELLRDKAARQAMAAAAQRAARFYEWGSLIPTYIAGYEHVSRGIAP